MSESRLVAIARTYLPYWRSSKTILRVTRELGEFVTERSAETDLETMESLEREIAADQSV